MALSHIFGNSQWVSSLLSPSNEKPKDRNRLSKPPQFRKPSKADLQASKGILDVFRIQSCLTISPAVEGIAEKKIESIPEVEQCLKSQPSTSSIYSLSHFPVDEMRIMAPRRAKTPVFFIGQLESRPLQDPAHQMAVQYRDILPLRSFTPCIEEEPVKTTRKPLRKVKCQQSLRDVLKQQSRRNSYSDCDTLVGSESPTSPASPVHKYFPEIQKLHLVEKPKSKMLPITPDERLEPAHDLENEVGLQLCSHLLTNELAGALFKQHPTENEDRASELQILLMIEAYEALQQNLRRQADLARLEGKTLDSHVATLEPILEKWLDSLYEVYDQAQAKKKKACVIIEEEEEEEEWPVRRSEDSGRTYVDCIG